MYASRLHWRLLIGTILLLMAAAWLAPRWLPKPEFQENRRLAARPAWPTRLRDVAAFRKAADAYVADHFPIRPQLIAVLNRARMMVGVSGSSRVIVGRDGWLYYDDDTHMGAARNDPALIGPQVRNWLMTLAGRTEAVRAQGGAYLVIAPPAKDSVYPEHAPLWFHGPSPDRLTVVLPTLARESGAGEVLSLYPEVAAAKRDGEKVFSRHDTHWTGYGAYAGYVGLMTRLHAMGLTDGPRPRSMFVSQRLRGRLVPSDLARMLGVGSLVDLDFPHLVDPQAASRGRITYLTAKHDWTAPQVIDTGAVGKPTLLITRDSFSNELLPFLYPHFSRIVAAHDQDGMWRPDLIARFKPDVVVLEVVESGLALAMDQGPPPSAEAVGRIDRVLATAALPAAPAGAASVPVLATITPPVLAALNGATPSPNCNVEVATFSPGGRGEVMLTVGGWLTELGSQVTSPDGFVRLRGPGFDAAANLRLDKLRPDVAAHFKNPTAALSGFVGAYVVARPRPGAYQATIYRRASRGWIACVAKQPLVAH